MTNASGTPDGRVADAPDDNWVDRFAPKATRPYLRLSRADRPIGTWLLLLPCWWSALLAAATTGGPSGLTLWIVIACGIGAFLMRGAGCTWNDITDQEFDAKVARTRSRPLPSGQVSVRQAVIWMIVQAVIAGAVLLTFNLPAILLGITSLSTVLVYPFAKRFTWWPQVFLGLAFNWGALLAWTAQTGRLEAPAILLYLSGIAWTLFYDTIYAHQDTEDDALIGVKSTARLFGENSKRWLTGFMIIAVLLLALATVLALMPSGNPLTLVLGLGAAWAMGWHMIWQLRQLDANDPATCLRLFHSNRDTGLLVTLFLAGASLV